MKHLNEEALLAYREQGPLQMGSAAKHLAECGHCGAQLEKLEAFLASLQALPVIEPGEDYERRIWRQIAPRLDEKYPTRWQVWALPLRWATVATVAVLLAVGFWGGRATRHHGADAQEAEIAQVRERVLRMAVDRHLGRSEIILAELTNAETDGAGLKLMDTSKEQRRAEDLLEENRLYRNTAQQAGDKVLANILGELECVLQDIARSPDQVTPAQFETLQKRIESGGILFKVRMLGGKLRQQQEAARSFPIHGAV